ncbi:MULTISPECIES: DUF695 domain-containing protein [Flavobacterium]|uniref:DUF695 domain-containing protein n=1 Tax=Flavobacterium TaxID=237 RepID=UPI001FCC1DB3|nr:MULTISPECIES: DUF695 domain-containing protein [Flavobacterium]UOK42384.1 DUF695 domain-containing protein [Flavobacterium enshiense]
MIKLIFSVALFFPIVIFAQRTNSESIEENWSYYYTFLDDKKALITLNRSVEILWPISEMREVAIINTSLIEPDKEGLPNKTEKDSFLKFEATVLEFLNAKQLKYVFVSSYFYEGTYYMVIYSDKSSIVKQAYDNIKINDFKYSLSVDAYTDPDWNYFNEYLKPNVPETLLLDVRDEIKNLENPETEKRVIHTVFFKSEQNALQLKEIEKKGLTLKGFKKVGDEYPKSEYKFQYQFRSKQIINKEKIESEVVDLYNYFDSDGLYVNFKILD